ncbi:MAG: NAD-dependent epimerase/dehydratase family protein [Oligoflexia bacterium]|nr:NAD-dependent epimerase/dehydratase family protein [Oligoflexia bacterium]
MIINNSTKILVTGGGGFLGSAIISMLLKESSEYEIFSISRNYYNHLESLNVRQIGGDISNLNFLREIFKKYSFDVVFHTAAYASMWGPWKKFEKNNIVATKNIIQVMKEFNIKKLIYTSSPSVVFGSSDLKNVDEETPYPHKHYSYYAKSKAEAERLVMAANDGINLLTVSLRPHLIWGPADQHLIPRVLKLARKRKLKIVGTGKNLVDITYIENAAHAHLLAYKSLNPSSPILGCTYFIADEKPVVLWDFINKILAINNISQVKSKVSFKFAYIAGWIAENIHKYLFNTVLRIDSEPPMTRFTAMQLAKSHYFNHERAHTDFGYAPIVSLEDGLKQMNINMN